MFPFSKAQITRIKIDMAKRGVPRLTVMPESTFWGSVVRGDRDCSQRSEVVGLLGASLGILVLLLGL